VVKLTGMDRSAISKLESGQQTNPTVETLVRKRASGPTAG
jgi:transcriptional regulator with XRE-family HTH domain